MAQEIEYEQTCDIYEHLDPIMHDLKKEIDRIEVKVKNVEYPGAPNSQYYVVLLKSFNRLYNFYSSVRIFNFQNEQPDGLKSGIWFREL